MTPGQARGVLLCFAVLLTAVAVNAIYLQETATIGSGPRRSERTPPPPAPTPLRVSHAPEAAVRIARFAPAPASDAAAPTPMAPMAAPMAAGRDTVRAIQGELAALGLGPVPRDGTLGVATRAAIMAYEYDHGLPITATPSVQLLQRLLLGAPDGGEHHAPPEVTSAEAAQVVAGVQHALADLGYLHGPTDGRFTAETARAIREFELDKGMVPKGRICAELVRRLGGPAGKATSR